MSFQLPIALNSLSRSDLDIVRFDCIGAAVVGGLAFVSVCVWDRTMVVVLLAVPADGIRNRFGIVSRVKIAMLL